MKPFEAEYTWSCPKCGSDNQVVSYQSMTQEYWEEYLFVLCGRCGFNEGKMHTRDYKEPLRK